MKLEDFKDKHKGEEMIVVGNGPGLKNIPFAFLESRPTFVINFFSYWVPWLKPTYWLALDPLCFEGAKYVNGTYKFIKAHNIETFKAIEEIEDEMLVYYSMPDQIPGFMWTKNWGLGYSTTAIAAAHLAHHMGASKALIVGFDCTHGTGIYEGKGLSRIPHFYYSRFHFTGYAEQWDDQFGHFTKWVLEQGQGMEVINLSIPTKAKNLVRGDYRDYWQPEDGGPND